MENPKSIDNSAQTIFSLSSASGRAGVALFRLSGPASADAVRHLTGRKVPNPRYAALRQLRSSQGLPIDEALTLWFPSPASFTGEDCVEFHTHGSPAVINGLSEALLSLGLRQAEPGEFTRRAVQNGKMDLTEAEGLADLIDAQSEGQRVQALRQMGGGLREIYEDWRERLLDALAQIEGEIDFPDESDIPDSLSHAAYVPLGLLASEMSEALQDMGRGAAIRSGLDIAIIGAPNVGKSTLINALTRRDVAITSPEAGTTRDIVEAQMIIAGLPVTLSDTAGLRISDNAIEAEGVKRARRRAEEAEITIYVVRPGIADFDPDMAEKLTSTDIKFVNISKGYDNSNADLPADCVKGNLGEEGGETALYNRLEEIVRTNFSLGQDPGLTRARHGDCVGRARNAILQARTNLGFAPELAGDDLRSALRALSELAGETDIEAVFDRIFSRFCVGK